MPSRARVLRIILAAVALGAVAFSVAVLFLIQEPRFPYNECESPTPSETFGSQWERLLLNRIDKAVHVGEAAPLGWDRVFIFRAYTPASEVGEATHTPDYVGDRLFHHVPEVETLMVFMSGTRPVCGFGWRAGYLESQRREFIRADATFRVEKRCSDCPFVLYPGNAAVWDRPTTGLTARFNGPGFALLTPAAERERRAPSERGLNTRRGRVLGRILPLAGGLSGVPGDPTERLTSSPSRPRLALLAAAAAPAR